ncbi:MAG TPA: CocE/NonD family hydrolase C-terminal non-catalytic domain-containing protein, partial [Acidimicrobiia bacterium]|nr:CocE/NonD family hydrolase C-terminal non-catalytic domain-containing protein [Acidimicrobiia bacterium]
IARWFAHHLRGDNNRVMEMPRLTAWVRTEPPYDARVSTGFWQAWQTETAVEFWEMPLGDGIQIWDGPQWVGSHAPAWDRAVVGSSDPVSDDEASLTFESAPLPADLDLFGSPQVELMVSSDQTAGLVAARILAVSPEGQAFLICRGSRNLVFPDDLSVPTRVEIGEWRQVTFHLLAASARIPAGWILRLSVAGADFPIAWPPGRRFRLSVDPARSRLRLPLLPVGGERLTIPSAPPPPSAPAETERDEVEWAVERRGSGTTFRRSLARDELQEGRLRYSTRQNWEVAVDEVDPASTSLVSNVALLLDRAGWKVAANGRVKISCDADSFYLEVGLEALEDGQAIFERTWEEQIRRIYA